MTAQCQGCHKYVKAHLSECGRCFAARTRQGLSVNAYAVNSNTPPAPEPKPVMVMSDYTGKPIMSWEAPTAIDPVTAAMWRGMCDCCPSVPADAANELARAKCVYCGVEIAGGKGCYYEAATGRERCPKHPNAFHEPFLSEEDYNARLTEWEASLARGKHKPRKRRTSWFHALNGRLR